jgi:hypothetical protein
MEDAEKRLYSPSLRLSQRRKEVREFLGVELGLESNRELERRHLNQRVVVISTQLKSCSNLLKAI